MSEDNRIRNLMMLDYSQLIMYACSLEELADTDRKEIERLNNIINELEEYICAIEYDERHYNETWQIAVRIHNKLQELKGVDKE